MKWGPGRRKGETHLIKGETWTELVKRISKECRYGRLSEDDIDYVLFEHTDFEAGAPLDRVEEQLRTYFNTHRKKAKKRGSS